MSDLNVQSLIDAGAHIGCRVGRWNPKMEPYILEARNQIHIIDLRQTIRGILRTKHFLKEIVASGLDVLFVGTKQQLRGEIAKVHSGAGMPYVEDRWIGGTLTNYEVIGSRIAFLEEMEKKESEGHLENLTKKEGARFMREKRKVYRNLHGIRDMFRLPGAMVVIDPKTERNAIREAQRMGIPVIGLVDTDCDPDVCDLIIPGNDDAIRSVALILEHLIEGVKAGKELRKERGVADPQRAPETQSVKAGGAPVPRPREGGPRRPSRPGRPQSGDGASKPAPSKPRQKMEGGVNRQVEIQALESDKAAGDAPVDAPVEVPVDAPKAETPVMETPVEAAPAATEVTPEKSE